MNKNNIKVETRIKILLILIHLVRGQATYLRVVGLELLRDEVESIPHVLLRLLGDGLDLLLDWGVQEMERINEKRNATWLEKKKKESASYTQQVWFQGEVARARGLVDKPAQLPSRPQVHRLFVSPGGVLLFFSFFLFPGNILFPYRMKILELGMECCFVEPDQTKNTSKN